LPAPVGEIAVDKVTHAWKLAVTLRFALMVTLAGFADPVTSPLQLLNA
jgi:hypothetical protein